MGGRIHRKDGRGYRRAVRLRRQQRGVVAVIGTLLALLLFFALFGVFLTQYLPLWMTDNEVQFTSQAQQSLASLKSYVDVQYQLRGPSAVAVPFTMESQGVPLLASPSGAQLSFTPITPGVFACISVTSPLLCTNPAAAPHGQEPLYNVTLGTLSMFLGNRYYPAQTFSYEDDAVIQSQSPTQQIVVYSPLFDLNTLGGTLNVTTTLLQLYGNATTTVSSGVQQVFSHYKFTAPYSKANYTTGFQLTFAIGTLFPCAWSLYLGSLVSEAGIPAGQYTLTEGGTVVAPFAQCPFFSGDQVVPVSLTLSVVNYLTLFFAGTQLSIGVGGGG